MTRVLVTGDLQIGAGKPLGRTNEGEGSRLADQAAALEQIAELAADADLVLVCGDIYEDRQPTRDEDEVFLGFLLNLHRQVPNVLLLQGNHDWRGFERASTIGIFRALGVQVAARPDVFEFAGVTVAALPWIAPGRLVANANGGDRHEIHALTEDLLIRAATELRERCPDDRPAILAAHWAVSGASLPTGLPVEQLAEPILPLEELEALGFDAVCLSHIHKAQMLSPGELLGPDQNGSHHADGRPTFFTGSPYICDWGEAAIPHGVWALSLDEGGVRAGFQPVADRTFVTVTCDLTTERGEELGLDETDALAAAIAMHFPLDGAVLRIRGKATPEQLRRIDLAAIRKLCEDSGVHKLAQVAIEPVRVDRARSAGLDETLAPLDALDRYLQAQGIEAWQADLYRQATSELMQEPA